MLAPETVLQNRYRIIRQLGQGGMGAVYEATDLRFGSIVALKRTLVSGEPLRRAFEREARLLNTLQHAGLPHVIDYFFEDDGQYLVMQYVPGDDLGQMLRRRAVPFPVDDVLVWLDQLLELLDFLHTHEPPIIHRDIKPENLKLTRRGTIILLDFGLAKGLADVASATTSASVLGYTPNYAPLEQIRGTGTDARSDLYAVAATVYHLLTKELPADAVARAECFVNGRLDSLRPVHELNPTVPVAVAATLHAALGLRRDERPVSAAVMRAALREARDASGSSSATSGDPVIVVPRSTAPQSVVTAPTATPVPPLAPPTLPPTYPMTTEAPEPVRERSGLAIKLVALVASIVVVLVVAAGVVLALRFRSWGPAVSPPSVPAPQPHVPDVREPAGPQGGVSPTPLGTGGPLTVSASATSQRAAIGEMTYGPELVLDGRPGTAWVEGADGAGVNESITLLLSRPAVVSRIRVMPGYFKSPQAWASNNRVERATITLSDGRQFDVTFDDEMREQPIAIGGAPTLTVMLTIDTVRLGGDGLDTGISEIAVDTQ